MSALRRSRHSERQGRGAGIVAGALLCAASLVAAPALAFAEEGSPPDSSEVAAVESAPEFAPASDPAPAPDSVPVLAVVTTEEDVDTVLEREVEEPTLTLFSGGGGAASMLAEESGPTLPAPGDPCYPAVCIDNGTILLAVNPTGELNTSDGTGSKAGPGDVGLEYLPTGHDATSPGCLCEGWGVADPATGTWGGANRDRTGTTGANLTVESFDWTASTAKSVVLVKDAEGAPVFRVTHEYVPSAATPNLYQVNVSIENITGETIAVVQYRRVMDWDIEPTAFSEIVTMNKGTAAALTFTSNDGFASSNPLAGPSDLGHTGNFTNAGPSDHGALFDFTFGPLSPGQVLTFVTFYGAAANEALAIEALRAVGAEAYSFGKPNLSPLDGSPNTFMFAFGNVGGDVIFPTDPDPVPEPEVIPAAVVTPAPAAAAEATLEVTGSPVGMMPLVWLSTALLLLGGAALWVGNRRERRDG